MQVVTASDADDAETIAYESFMSGETYSIKYTVRITAATFACVCVVLGDPDT